MEDESDDKDDTKRKSRNLSEKKRRDQFNTLVNDLSALITTSNRKMDKSTVLKSTIAFLKHHNEATNRSKVFEIQQDWKPSFLTNDEFTHLMLESLDGFIIVFSSTGIILYASESITSQLGYLPNDLVNMTIFDLTYELDQEKLFNIFLNPKPVIEPLQTDINTSNQITFHVHLRRGGIERVDANAYELVKFVGYFRNDVNFESIPIPNTQTLPKIFQKTSAIEIDTKLIFVGTGRIQTPQLIREMSAIDPTRNEFTSKHSMEWKFLFLDHRAPPIIGYMPFEVLGTSGYDYYHFDDLESIVASHEDLMKKGEGKSCYYRFLTKGQQWLWLQTDFYISYHINSKPDYVVCTHKVVSYSDVIKQNKLAHKNSNNNNNNHKITLGTNNMTALKSSTLTLPEVETNSNQGLDTVQLITHNSSVGGVGANAILGTLTETSPTLETASIMWPSASSNSAQLTPLKSSRPASSYGNISSAGISPTVKRKRYFHHSRGNESDSTSMSADSAASRQSLMTHFSSSRQRNATATVAASNLQVQNNSHSQQQSINLTSHQTAHHSHQHHLNHHLPAAPQHALQLSQEPPKVIPMLPQHSIAPSQIVTSTTCQFPQPAFPIRSPQIVSTTFLEPPQYLTAIPVQPVIAPFPVTPVLSPLPVNTNQPDLLPSAMLMSPTQTHLQDQLQRKHDELQKLIMQQQDELRIVSEQLLLARYTLLQPMVPMNYNNAATNSRNFGFNNNVIEPQFNQYGFALNSEQMQNSQDQQMLLQQQQQQQHHQQQQQHSVEQQTQNLQNQTQQSQHQPLQHHSAQTQHQQLLQQQQQQPQQQLTLNASSQQQQQQQQQPTSNILSRSVPDLEQIAQEEIDAFFNLSPVQTINDAQNALNQLANTTTGNNSLNMVNNSNDGMSSNAQPILNTYGNNTTVPNEDSLLSYMRLSSPTLNFQMGISDDGSESQSEDSKLMPGPTQQSLMQQRQQQQQQNRSYYLNNNPFEALGNQNTNHVPNDLEILPYQMSQEQSQNLFNSPHASGTSQ